MFTVAVTVEWGTRLQVYVPSSSSRRGKKEEKRSREEGSGAGETIKNFICQVPYNVMYTIAHAVRHDYVVCMYLNSTCIATCK